MHKIKTISWDKARKKRQTANSRPLRNGNKKARAKPGLFYTETKDYFFFGNWKNQY